MGGAWKPGGGAGLSEAWLTRSLCPLISLSDLRVQPKLGLPGGFGKVVEMRIPGTGPSLGLPCPHHQWLHLQSPDPRPCICHHRPGPGWLSRRVAMALRCV